MTMRRIFAAIALGTFLLLPGYADLLPISGIASGTFSNPSGTSTVDGATWTYDGLNGFVTFAGNGFSGSVGDSFNFGSITLTNTSSTQLGTDQFTATLNVLVKFSQPDGKEANFADGLQILAKSQNDKLKLNFGGFPGPQTFTDGDQTYTVSYDGFFDSDLNKIESLLVESGTASAFLRGTVTATPTATATSEAIAPVPEPSSVVLMLTALGGCIVALRRKRARI